MVQATISPDVGPPAVTVGTGGALGAELVRLVKLLVAMRQHAPTTHGAIDTTHYPVLFALANGPLRISDLAGCAHSDVSTVSRQVSFLVQHHLLAKVPDPADGRAHRVSLTDEGRAAIDQALAARGQWLSAIMTGWSDEDARQFLHQVSRFTASLEAAHGRFERAAR